MKELPKVFHNKIDKKFDNNRSVFYSNNTYEEDRNVDTRTVLQKINEIFSPDPRAEPYWSVSGCILGGSGWGGLPNIET